MKQIYKFLLSLAILFACCVVADCFIGMALDRILDKVPNNGNETGAAHYAIKRVNDPVLIVGSSRAKNQYDPLIIEDSLSLKTYNVGRRGYYLSYQCCFINMILDRYTPSILIWDLSMDTLFENGDDYVNKLRPYYWDYAAVREVINEKEGKAARIKVLSNAYRYNGMALPVLYRGLAGGLDEDPNQGLSPLIYSGQSVDPELSYAQGLSGPIDSVRVNRLHNTLQRLSDAGVKVFVFDSPNYALLNPDRDMSSENIIREECQRFSIPVFDNRMIDFFLQHPEMYYDTGHIFEDGAEIYSQIVAHQIVQELAKESDITY